MTGMTNASGLEATLDLPLPRLVEGRFSNLTAFTDEALFEACGVRIAFTERSGGVSVPPYDSLNLGLHVNDNPESVRENRRRVCEAFGIDPTRLIVPNQVHGADVAVCENAGDIAETREFAAEGSDAVAVGCDGVAALLCFADCTPVIIVAPSGKFAVAHCGWRGVVYGAWATALSTLCELTGEPPERFNVYIGPYIHACHFEVGEEVAKRYFDSFGEASLVDERHVDMGAALRCGFASMGVAPERIADVDMCTVCDAGERFYSYRASGGTCGRHGAFAARILG